MAKQIFDVSEYQFNGGFEVRAWGISLKLMHCLLPYDIGGGQRARCSQVWRIFLLNELKQTRILKMFRVVWVGHFMSHSIHGTNGIFTYIYHTFYLKRTTIHIGNYTVRPHGYPMVGICVLIPAKTKVWRNMLGVQGRREFNAMEQQSPGLYFGVGARCARWASYIYLCECLRFVVSVGEIYHTYGKWLEWHLAKYL